MKTVLMIALLMVAVPALSSSFFPLLPGTVWTLVDEDDGSMVLGLSNAIIWHDLLVFPRSEIIDGVFMGLTYWSEDSDGRVLLHGVEHADAALGSWYFSPPAVYHDPSLQSGESAFISVGVSEITDMGFQFYGYQPFTLYCEGNEILDTPLGPIQTLLHRQQWSGTEGPWRYGNSGLFYYGFGVGPARIKSTISSEIDYLLTELVGLEITDSPPLVPYLNLVVAPNPFNPTTRLSFTLDHAAPVSLEIVDLTGRRITTLHTGPLGAGSHAFTWQPQDLASGIYLARLQVASTVSTIRLTLVE